ncbi:MAG: hypothetical protein ACREGI_00720, partial [Candidatus Levyibacteriota bacterium]
MNKKKSGRKKKNFEENTKTLKIALIFGVVLVFLIGISLCIKGVLLLKKSKFDGQHQIIILVKQPTKQTVLNISPDTKSVAIVTFTGTQNRQLSDSFPLPIDATINDAFTVTNPSSFGNYLLFHAALLHTNLTIVDIIKLFFLLQTIPNNNVTTATFSLPLSIVDTDKKIPSLFTDNTLYQDGMTVAIVNA